jgi:CRP-like cAMP-binding protein
MAELNHVDATALMRLREKHGAVYQRGQVLYRQGETSSELYVVLSGAVDLFVRDAPGATPRPAGVAQPGAYFGELACFGRMPRRTTAVIAQDDTALLAFTGTTAVELLERSPRFMLQVVATMAAQLLELEHRAEQLAAAAPAGVPWRSVAHAALAAEMAQPAESHHVICQSHLGGVAG